MALDNTQKAALAAIPVLIVGVILYMVATTNLEANEQAERCATWSDEIESIRLTLDAHQASLGGTLDLNGDVKAERLAFNAEVHDWNTECANGDYSNE